MLLCVRVCVFLHPQCFRIVAITGESKSALASALIKGKVLSVVGSASDLSSIA